MVQKITDQVQGIEKKPALISKKPAVPNKKSLRTKSAKKFDPIKTRQIELIEEVTGSKSPICEQVSNLFDNPLNIDVKISADIPFIQDTTYCMFDSEFKSDSYKINTKKKFQADF